MIFICKSQVMKKTLIDETKRIFEIMSKLDKKIILTELNEKYLNKLLDKINQQGFNSLTNYEKLALEKMSNNEDVDDLDDFDNFDDEGDLTPKKYSLGTTSNTLRFTTSRNNDEEPLVEPQNKGKLFGKSNYKYAYIHGEAERLAGFDIPIFIDGNLSQLDESINKQDIRMLLPNGEYECIATPVMEEDDIFQEPVYYITLKNENI